ncbi:phosphotransferase [Marinilongibacter aquaticus]|uniref:phosphotransferase n=1 Tax=Marinilongibacter aquaticus TaxID=2975157 RepID=UPI0021BCFFAF|nr:phosphotransferase [Marinilongibacter aquaticus]UBM59669.1 phosphotransferase [Marinilongibacter aquaticus]
MLAVSIPASLLENLLKMTIAPALSSILSAQYLADLVAEKYALEGKVVCTMLKTGVNHSYAVHTEKEKFVFRVYCRNWRSEQEVGEEIKHLNALAKGGIRVSTPVKDKNENYIQRIQAIEGQRMAVLFSFARGNSIKNPSVEICQNLGAEIGKMHQFVEHKSLNRKTYSAHTLVTWAYEMTKGYFGDSSQEMLYFERANTKISEAFASADSHQLRSGIVHLDLWHENMKVDENGEITLFDFDNCGNGYLFLDLSYALMLLFKNEPDFEQFEKKKEALLAAYGQSSTLSDAEIRLIPYGGLAIWLHYTGIHVQRFDDFSNQFFSAEFLKFWIQIVDRWMKYNGVDI